MLVQTAAARCIPCAASKWATSSSWARATAMPWAAHSWIAMGSINRSSWDHTALAAVAYWRVLPRSTTTNDGLIWPISVAPYPVHLVALTGRGDATTQQQADQLYAELQAAGIDVLYDDRDESPGVKFNDADLIGIPIRLTVSERALNARWSGVQTARQP